MDVSINADVKCSDGICGRVTNVIVNPVLKKVTHVVVKEKTFPHGEYLVPLDLIEESTSDLMTLRCTRSELLMQDPFSDYEFVEQDPSMMSEEYTMNDDWLMWPYAANEDMANMQEIEHVPPGELPIRRGAHVAATDGHVGQVDEFLVDPANGHITHLVLREGHLWGKNDVTIPISEIARIEEGTVYLKLNKLQIEVLPKIAVKRHQHNP